MKSCLFYCAACRAKHKIRGVARGYGCQFCTGLVSRKLSSVHGWHRPSFLRGQSWHAAFAFETFARALAGGAQAFCKVTLYERRHDIWVLWCSLKFCGATADIQPTPTVRSKERSFCRTGVCVGSGVACQVEWQSCGHDTEFAPWRFARQFVTLLTLLLYLAWRVVASL